MKYQRVIMWFRQDLRVQDNTALIAAVADAPDIIPVFVMDTQILARSPADDRRIGFLLDAVKQLDQQLQKLGSKLYVYHGRSQEIIPLLVRQWGADAVYANRSYGHGSGTRDTDIQSSCDALSVRFVLFGDYLLVEPQEVPTRKVFTPFYKLRQHIPKRSVQSMNSTIHTSQIDCKLTQNLTLIDLETAKPEDFGGSDNLHRPVNHVDQTMATFDYDGYEDTRNIPSIDGSSRLSPYLKFGLISIRQLYGLSTQVTSQVYTSELAWREFWQHIIHRFPQTLEIEFQEKRRNLNRENDEALIQARKDGTTGYPIVDAGMRQLREQNRIHNRVRMVVASFLTKDLLVDRRIGEQHFAEYLIDYDRNVNIGNRQRSASVGADPKPLRIFSPILQAQRFDPNASYIKRRIPELAGIDAASICDPVKSDLFLLSGGRYPRPIIDHVTNSKRAKEMYKSNKLKVTS